MYLPLLTLHGFIICAQLGNENTRILLTPEESDTVMPKLESMFMSYQEEED